MLAFCGWALLPYSAGKGCVPFHSWDCGIGSGTNLRVFSFNFDFYTRAVTYNIMYSFSGNTFTSVNKIAIEFSTANLNSNSQDGGEGGDKFGITSIRLMWIYMSIILGII